MRTFTNIESSINVEKEFHNQLISGLLIILLILVAYIFTNFVKIAILSTPIVILCALGVFALGWVSSILILFRFVMNILNALFHTERGIATRSISRTLILLGILFVVISQKDNGLAEAQSKLIGTGIDPELAQGAYGVLVMYLCLNYFLSIQVDGFNLGRQGRGIFSGDFDWISNAHIVLFGWLVNIILPYSLAYMVIAHTFHDAVSLVIVFLKQVVVLTESDSFFYAEFIRWVASIFLSWLEADPLPGEF